MQSASDIELYARDLIKILHECAKESLPMSGFNPYTRPDWTKNVKSLHDNERAKRRIWMAEGRPRGMRHPSYREYKRAKRCFRNALDAEHEKYMRETYRDIDEAAECDIRLFWRLTKRKKPRSTRIYPEIVDNSGNSHRDPVGVADSFASFFEEVYSPLSDIDFDSDFKTEIEEQYDFFKLQCAASNNELPGGPITVADIEKVIQKLKA